MEFTPEQITEIISEITNGEQGFQGLVKQGLESLMHSERAVHNAEHNDVSNGYRDRRVCYGGKGFELRDTPADHDSRCSRPDGSSYEDCALRALNFQNLVCPSPVNLVHHL